MTASSGAFAPGSTGQNGPAKSPQASLIPQGRPRPDGSAVVAAPPAGFVSRAIAFAIDLGIVLLLVFGTSSFAQLLTVLLPQWLWFAAALPAVIGAAGALIPFTYFFLTVALTGKTVGKGLMGLRIVTVGGKRLSVARSFVRVPAYFVSIIPLFVGFLWVLVDRDRRGWHDIVAGTRVVYEPRSPQL